MSVAELHYYTSLEPFRLLFATGVPILTYHKLGPRPRGVRLKGMYLSAELFRRQLAELRDAGFRSTGLQEVAGKDGNPGKQVAITFDDGFANVLEPGLAILAENHFRATQFLVARFLGRTSEWQAGSGEVLERLMDVSQVREWLSAGHEIGSHTLTHPCLGAIPLAQAREEIGASKKMLEDAFGVPVRHFCYPYGDWNPAIRDLVAEAGYQTACTTAFGLNGADTSPRELRRITARYASRKLKILLRGWFGR
jgi:peptidoglycan/xylan/chitin deacetylase (PgdA/CDA1 family)